MYFTIVLLCSDDGKITVYNVGTKADGEFEDIKGTAEAPNPAAPAALLVTFPIGER
jgi:lipocalin